ncbi:MAG: carboxypeptidase regulatory-like domain-containing protein [Terriglobales bacterium]
MLGLVLGATAQVQNGQFSGSVTDPSGAAIAGATVTVTNLGTSLSVATKTNETGLYTVKELPIGTYKISVEAKGFKTTSNSGVSLNAGTIARVDFKLELGQTREVIEVSGEAAAVNTEDSKLASTVTSTQIANLPLNGRNVYDLIQMAPGAVNVSGVDFENGHSTVVNGLREDFNGFLINGVSNKGLSGGVNNTPIQDTVQEFQQLQLNMSAQYGNSAGSTTNLVTKSGTNAFHGSLWEYNRNDKFDANEYFLNQQGVAKPALRFNQFGGTIGGPIVKDKLFFFGSYQGDRFTTVGTPQTIIQESPQWENAVLSADSASNTSSVAGLLYKNFKPGLSGGAVTATMDDYITGGNSSSGFTSYVDYLCPDSYTALGGSTVQAQASAARMASILGVLPTDNFGAVPFTGAPCSSTPGQQAGTIGRTAAGSSMPFQVSSVAIFKSQTQTIGNLFNGNEASLRVDYNWNNSNRFYANFNWFKSTDGFGPCDAACARGFTNPQKIYYPNGQISYVRTFSPTVLNEFRAGYSGNKNLIQTTIPGVPSVLFDDASLGFGSYSGYPQFFKENVYSYSDMVSISHGNHNIKVGVDLRRNIENSEFNVARPSYYFFDPLFFAADQPYSMSAGVNPNICTPPCASSSFNPNPNGNLESNVRHWRNLEMGAYFQDDWKVTKRLTLNLGMRYDLFTRHNELDNKATTFLLGPGSDLLTSLRNANVPAGTVGMIGGTTYDCTSASASALAQLAGVCGPGGFAPSPSLGQGDHNDFGPRLGFAWDMFGDGKTSLRGGFGVAYEGTLYNPLSNSRWNLPYYSFNSATNGYGGDVNDVIYGPTTCTGTGISSVCQPSGGAQFGPGGVVPTYLGTGSNPNMGPGAQATGNLGGWDAANPNQAQLTGIVFPEGIRDPYVYNYFLSVQREITTHTTLEVDYVGDAGHKLFRSEQINREPGMRLPTGECLTDNFGRNWCGLAGQRLNANYGNLRNWRNSVNSIYSGLQASLKHQLSRGVLFNVNYTYSHAIDNGSTWHSGATTANGAAGGEGYSSDVTLPGLDRGNSIFDIRQRLVLNYVWELPGKNLHGALGAIAGGWSLNGIWSFQSGAHWQPYDSRTRNLVGDCSQAGIDAGACDNIGGDYNLDRASNDRPSSNVASFGSQSRNQWANGWCSSGSAIPQGPGVSATPCQAGAGQPAVPLFSVPCLGCAGNLGRNNFVGPGNWAADMTLAKIFKITERTSLRFEAAGFNVFNRANFILATAGGGAHNKVSDGQFGEAAGTLNARNLQFGLKLTF